jgi:putative ABC transport system ATP-binding protein
MLEIKGATKIYGRGATQIVALDNASFQVNKGDFIAVMGPSGSGKSTLLNVIGCLDRLSGGEIILGEQRIDDLSEEGLVNIRRRKISYIFQQYHLLPSLTALENVMLPIILSGDKDKEGKALRLLQLVGLEKRAQQRPGQLSGGEQQRVAIARALVNDPLITLADEPTGNLDQKTGREILDLLKQMNDEGCTIIMVTHNNEAAERAKEILLLQDGKIVDRKINTK